MMGDMDITEFLEARITEDEAVAQKAAASVTPVMDASREPVGPAWEARKGMVLGQPDANGYSIPLWDNEGSSTLSMHPDVSAHVARHDPARVLAECEAKRKVVPMHGPVKDEGWISGAAHGYLWCGMCGSVDDSPEPYPCGTLKAMASVYKDHPDYNPRWAIDTRA